MGQIKYYSGLIRRSYKDNHKVSALWLVNYCLILLFCLSVFLLFAYEPSSQWHSASFVLSRTEYRSVRYGGVLYLYTTDGKSFVLNENVKVIRNELKSGNTYDVVYSSDLFHDIIKALKDDKTEYLNLALSADKFHNDCMLWIVGASFAFALLIIVNGFFIGSLIHKERKRLREYQNRKRM